MKGTFHKPEVHLCLPKPSSSIRHVHTETRSVLKTANPQILELQTDHLQVESPCKRKCQLHMQRNTEKQVCANDFWVTPSGFVCICMRQGPAPLCLPCAGKMPFTSAATEHQNAEWSSLEHTVLYFSGAVRVAVGYKATRRLFWASTHPGVQATARSLHSDLPPLQEVVQLAALLFVQEFDVGHQPQRQDETGHSND